MKRIILSTAVLAVFMVGIGSAVNAPLLFAAFDIEPAESLPWAATGHYIGIRDDYDARRVVADTEKLLASEMPTIVRMETLRRAAVYASRDRRVAEQLVAFVAGRIASVPRPGSYPDAMALFDAGYVIEVLKELEEFVSGSKVVWGRDPAIVGITRPYDSRGLIERSAALRPHDGAIQLALALLSPAGEADAHLRKARESAVNDALLANNLARLRLQ